MRFLFLFLFFFLLIFSCVDSTPREASAPVLTAIKKSEPGGEAEKKETKTPLKIDEKSENAEVKSDFRVIESLSQRAILGVRPISMRSLSLKIAFGEGEKAVFKPVRKGDSTARFEVAFYLMSKMLKVGRVPASTMRLMPRAKIVGHLKVNFPEAAEAFNSNVKDHQNGMVAGAVIEWIKGVKESPFDRPGARKEMEKLLAMDGPSESEAPLASKLSSAIVLDYLTGNWDRFSGGNLFLDESGENLVLIDNNGAFSKWSKRQEEKMNSLLTIVQRCSGSLLARLRAMDRLMVEESIAPGSWINGRPILSEAEVSRIFERKDNLIVHFDSLIEAHGEEKILVFP